VGAVIANYNHAKFLDVAISSLLKNKFLSEITVVDDASTDESIKIIEKYTNVNLLRNSHQKGASYSLDLGIRTLNTDFVILQGSDDISNPDRIETQLSTIIEKNCSVVVGRNEFIDDNGEKLAKNDLFKHGSHENLFESLFLKGNSICAPAVMLKREHYLKKGGFRHNLHQLQDYFLWLQFAFENEIRFHDDVVVQYRLHKKNLSRESTFTNNRINIELYLIYEYFFHYFLVLLKKEQRINQVKIGDKILETEVDVVKYFLIHPNKVAQHSASMYFNHLAMTELKIDSFMSRFGFTIFDLILANGKDISILE